MLERTWTGLRDAFSSSVLGTTSPHVPGLGGGLSRLARLTVTAVSLAIAFAAGLLLGSPWGSLSFFPALMIAGIFGGGELALPALALAIFICVYLFPSFDPWVFAGMAAAQTAIALALRVFFRESRRWGVRYRRLLAATSSAVTVSDGQGRITRPHPELEQLIGMAWPDYARLGWLSAVHPDDHKLMTPGAPFNEVPVHRAEVRLKEPRTGEWRWHMMRAVPLTGDNGELEEWISVLTDVHDRKLAREQQDMVIGEARHRLKNFMTIIDSLAKSSRPVGASADVDAYQKKFLGRLHALSAASDLALAGNYAAMDANAVVAATLAPFLETDAARLSFGGPRLLLSEATGGTLALATHELVTNAIKHGALSVPQGRVSFTWSITPGADGNQVAMVWAEQGGPPPAAPDKEGYGTRVIRFVPSREQGGSVTMDYAPGGYVCRIVFTQPAKPRVPTLEAD